MSEKVWCHSKHIDFIRQFRFTLNEGICLMRSYRRGTQVFYSLHSLFFKLSVFSGTLRGIGNIQPYLITRPAKLNVKHKLYISVDCKSYAHT